MPGKLTPYQRKRDFSRTPEPAGQAAGDGAGGPRRARFVVQRHRARRLHYDLRFEIGGVLVSWAVPKGPTLDPDVRRIAVHVEDHPLEYLDFEGVIPRGQYGGGDVIVWDRGTWEPHATDDPAAAVEAGEFHADVDGDKLRGRFILVRTGGPGLGPVAAGAQARRVRGQRLGPGGLPAPPCSAGAPTTRSRPTRPGYGARTCPRPKRRCAAPPTEDRRVPGGRQPDSPATGPSPDELAALDALGAGGTWHVFGRDLRLTNLDKVLFPGPRGRGAGQQAGPGPLRGADRPGRPALPVRTAR